jgi:hypothetical protein
MFTHGDFWENPWKNENHSWWSFRFLQRLLPLSLAWIGLDMLMIFVGLFPNGKTITQGIDQVKILVSLGQIEVTEWLPSIKPRVCYAHMLHVWNIYQHLLSKSPKCR